MHIKKFELEIEPLICTSYVSCVLYKKSYPFFCFLDGKLQEDFELVLCDILPVDYDEKRSTTTLSTL